MKTTKLFKKFQSLFEKQSRKDEKNRKKLLTLVLKLEKKKRKLQVRIAHEQNEAIRKRYLMEIEILDKQLEKAENIMRNDSSPHLPEQ